LITPVGSQGLKPNEENQTVRNAEELRHPKTAASSNIPSHSGPAPETVPLPVATSAGEASAPETRYFCGVAGVGLDTEVARRANSLPSWLRGNGGYVFSSAPALLQFAPVLMSIRVPNPEQPDFWVTRSAKPTVVAAFANAPTYSGGMKIAPHAQLDDGKLDICIVSDIDKFKLFCLFPTIYFGRDLNIPEVEYFQVERLKLETEIPLDVYADGEYVCRTPIEVGLVPKALSVIVP
jgi:diacylglycerol kinase (ATP)